MVKSSGIAYEEKLGQLFCKTSAKEIINLLVSRCQESGNVTFQKSSEVTPNDIHRDNDTWWVKNDQAENLIIATGGPSVPTIGASRVGFEIAQRFDHQINKLDAALVGVTSPDHLKKLTTKLAGTSLPARVSFNNNYFDENLLFTHKGISGPSILQISLYWEKEKAFKINFLPDHSFEKLIQSKMKIKKVLQQHLPNKFVDEFLNFLNIDSDKKPHELSKKDLNRLSENLHHFMFCPPSTEGYRKAEVTRGGVCTSQVNKKTMESKLHSGFILSAKCLM